MARMIIHAGIIAVIAGSTLAAALPAQAMQIRPQVTQGLEYVDTWYSNAQETTVVGTRHYGSCGLSVTGVTSPYMTLSFYLCPSPG
jgi:hypothetical protein